MTDFNGIITLTTTDASEGVIDALIARFDGSSPAVSQDRAGHVEVYFTVEAENLLEAGIRVANEATGFEDGEVVHVAVMPSEYFDTVYTLPPADLDEPVVL